MYVMLGTCPDLAYAVGMLSQYLTNPGVGHLNTVNHIPKYLNTTKDHKLLNDGKSR